MRWSIVSSIAMLVGVGTIACAAGGPLEYERDVKPILEKNCFKCHGSEKQKGGLATPSDGG